MRRSLPELVLDSLGPQIVSGELPPGSVIRLEEVERRFEVSRTVAREAVKVLESIGLVESRRRVGAEVLPREEWAISSPLIVEWGLGCSDRPTWVHQIGELREGLEPIAARLAAANATPAHLERLRDAADGLVRTAEAGDLDAFLELDIAFHGTVLELSGNPFLMSFTSVIGHVLAHRDLRPPRPDLRVVALHVEVAEAIAAGDAAHAEAVMRRLVGASTDDPDELVAEPSRRRRRFAPVDSDGKPS